MACLEYQVFPYTKNRFGPMFGDFLLIYNKQKFCEFIKGEKP